MHAINIKSLINAKRDLSTYNFQAYIKTYQLNPRMRSSELADLAIFIEELERIGNAPHLLNEFFVGYSIQQISKEFDLLRIGENYLLNIELKLESSLDRIETQLQQNAYYLRFLNKPVYNFTFVSNSRTLYKLENNVLTTATFQELYTLLIEQNILFDVQIDDLFDPIHYLVSPIEQPIKFMNEEYFLTAQQTTFKMEILRHEQIIKRWFAIEGGAGTGKTLLTYDIAKHYIKTNKRVKVIHCRPLHPGQHHLNEHLGWDISTIEQCTFEEVYDVLIVDEAHFLQLDQLQQLINYEEKIQPKVIVSYDPQHFFNGSLIIQELERYVELIRFELKIILRTNKEIYSFINSLFDLSYEHSFPQFKSISVTYFSNKDDAIHFTNHLKKKDWKIINVLDRTNAEQYYISNDVIGSEYDYVAAILDENFYYKTNLRLTCREINSFNEQPTRLLYQALTRTRKKLHLIIIHNEELLKNILSILHDDEL